MSGSKGPLTLGTLEKLPNSALRRSNVHSQLAPRATTSALRQLFPGSSQRMGGSKEKALQVVGQAFSFLSLHARFIVHLQPAG